MRSTSNFIFGVVAFIIFIIIFFIIIITVRGGSNTGKNDNPVADLASKDFSADKAKNKTLKFTVLGGVKADEKYKKLEMTVSPTARNIRVIKTYSNEVEKEANLYNNQAAYDAFFAAVDGEGFFDTKKEAKKPDENYACPTQKHYRIEVVEGAEILHSTWATFCADSRYGTYNGYVTDVNTLFTRQFPDYRKFMSGVKLN
jgi:hypothetical protein